MSGPIVFILRIFLTTVLYAFLALALYTLWQELKQHGTLLVARKIPPITLSVESVQDEPRPVHFQQPNVTIGRNPTSEFPINEDSISSRHARLSYHHGHWWLEDLGSKNGTYLNNEILQIPTVVVSGDRIRCGETSMVVTFSRDDQTSTIDGMPKNDKND
jgi:pSer/pThr/pTyr-binding forkhead associated (FHA) protein